MLFSFENIYRQYILCRQNKRNAASALAFEYRQEENLLQLQEELTSRTYSPGRSVCFFAERPKLREIFAAQFRDRVVHHILVDYLERIWEPIFIHDSYACRREKGIHRGVQRLQQFIRQATLNGSRPAWFLQLDIRSYFVGIDHEILFGLIDKKLPPHAYDARWLARTLIFHPCTADPIMHGNPGLLEKLPHHKSLFFAPPGRGLPIGNLTSQFFANVYLNRLDQFVKHTLKCHHYLRYCDDFVLLSSNRNELLRWEAEIGSFLKRKLLLELNDKRRRSAPVNNGIDFLGYIVRRDYLLVRRRVVGNLLQKLDGFQKQLVHRAGERIRFKFDNEIIESLASSLSSYLGHFKLANARSLAQSIWSRYPFLDQYLELDIAKWRLVRRFKHPRSFRSVRSQYAYFQRRFPGDVLLFQVGCYIEFYREDARKTAVLLGLERVGSNRRGVKWGAPLELLDRCRTRLAEAGKSVVFIAEGLLWSNGKERKPVWREVSHHLHPEPAITEGSYPFPSRTRKFKPLRTDGTARVAVWESRSPPGINTKSPATH